MPFWNFKVNGSTMGKVRVYTVIPVYTLKSKFLRFRHILLFQSILLWAFPKISTLYWYSTLYGYSRGESRAISQEMPQPSITKIRLKITYLNFHANFPGANELILFVRAVMLSTILSQLFHVGNRIFLSFPCTRSITDNPAPCVTWPSVAMVLTIYAWYW